VGYALDRFDRNRVIATAYLLGGVFIFTLGGSVLSSSWLPVQVALSGLFMGGAQTGVNALAPTYYPTRARATGVGWMHGIGRLGAIFGSVIGGVLLSMGLGFGTVFAILAVPALLAAAAVTTNRFAARSIAYEGNT
jgi:AAHS family 4-hydroxybenzoate transporter-like MFS transporter